MKKERGGGRNVPKKVWLEASLLNNICKCLTNDKVTMSILSKLVEILHYPDLIFPFLVTLLSSRSQIRNAGHVEM